MIHNKRAAEQPALTMRCVLHVLYVSAPPLGLTIPPFVITMSPYLKKEEQVVNLSAIYFANNMMMCMCDEGSSCDLPGA